VGERIRSRQVAAAAGTLVGAYLVVRKKPDEDDAHLHGDTSAQHSMGYMVAIVGAMLVAVGYTAVRVLRVRFAASTQSLLVSQSLGLLIAGFAAICLTTQGHVALLSSSTYPAAIPVLSAYLMASLSAQWAMAEGMANAPAAVSGVVLVTAEILGAVVIQAVLTDGDLRQRLPLSTLGAAILVIVSTIVGVVQLDCNVPAVQNRMVRALQLTAVVVAPSRAHVVSGESLALGQLQSGNKSTTSPSNELYDHCEHHLTAHDMLHSSQAAASASGQDMGADEQLHVTDPAAHGGGSASVSWVPRLGMY